MGSINHWQALKRNDTNRLKAVSSCAHVFPSTNGRAHGRGVFSFLSPAGFYVRWLEKPLYDTSSLRILAEKKHVPGVPRQY